MFSFLTRPLRRCASLLTVLCGARLTAADVSTNALPPVATNRVDFVHDIKPIFDRSCIRCHGPEKPKSNFRLTSRDAAIKGGENGVAIIPSDSAKSPLIHYVARLPEVEDMWMPPPGKGDPLTEAEVSMLRAWVDQDAAWEEAAPPPKVEISLSPTFGWSTVDGNERVFREHQWLREGWSGGVSQFRLRERLTEDTFLTAEGHALEDDYNVRLTLERPELGFLRAGIERYRKFSSDSGGRYEPFEPDIFRLDKDLHLNIGRAWADLGFTVPDLPRIVIGYEYQYREGTKSTLQWGPVTQGTDAGGAPRMRNIYPAYKWIDEQVHIVKMDASYSIGGFEFDNRFRGEFYDLDTERFNARGLDRDAGQLRPGVFEEIHEGQTHFEGANTFRVEKQFRDWLFGSAGYHFARLDADAFFDLNWNTVSGPPGFRQDWTTPEIVLDREIHAGSVSTLLGPWAGLTASAGVQTEFSEQHGMGGAVVETGFGPFPPIIATNAMASDIDRKALQETLALRYTTIPFTVLFAEARLQQESIDHFEEQESSGPSPQPLFLRDTEASSDLKDFRGGFTTSPWRRLSLTAHYRRYEKDSYYDHLRDVLLGGEGFGYSAFIRRRKVVSDEIEPKLVWHTASWLKTTLSYKLVASDFHTATEGISVVGTDYAGSERIYAANYDAHVYSVNFSLSPWRRFYLSTTFSFQDTRTAASVPDDVDSVVPYKGNVYSVITSGTVPLSEKNDLQVSYSFSHADYEQDNEVAGLPVGIVYDLHGTQIGLTRRIAKNIATNLRYGFFLYDEPTSSGVNDYTAHLVFGTVVVRFP